MVNDPRLRADLVVALETAGAAHVWLAATPAEALAWAEPRQPGLVLVDTDLPAGTAQETCVALAERSDLLLTQIWLLIDSGQDPDTCQTLGCYADRMLPKTLSPAALCQEILAGTDSGPALRWLGD